MKLGVDARLLSRPITGIGRYTLEMCRLLAEREDVALFLYSPSPLPDHVRSAFSGVTIREANIGFRPLQQAWIDTFLPMWASRDGVEILWGPAHRLPRWLPPRIARVVTIHDLVWKHAPQTMRALSRLNERLNMPHAVRAADMVLADSEATAKDVAEAFRIPWNRMVVVPPGITKQTHPDVPPPSVPFAGKTSYALFVGTLEPRKNLPRILQAYSQLGEERQSEMNLVIAGGKGWGDERTQDLVDKYNLKQHVHFVGRVDDAALAGLYAHCAFVLMPSLYEGFGLPLAEGMSYGKPVLTSSVSSMPEVAGDAGILVDPLHVHSIRAGLERMIGDSGFRASLASRATAQAAKFDWRKSAQKAYAAFQSAISKRLPEIQ